MSTIRAMFVGQGGSGLPEDRFVNVFHFTGSGSYDTDQATVATRVIQFYNEVETGQVNAVGAFLSPYVQRAAEVRCYDLTTEKPRVPTIHPFTLPAVLSGQGMVEEMALCLSYHGAPPVTARRRGRLYLGPFNSAASVLVPATTTEYCHPGAELVSVMKSAAELLASGSGTTWSIRSLRPAENFVPITGGYIDNAFDTQRRRGPKPTDRLQWLGVGI